MDNKCQECQSDFASEAELHKHIKSHRMRLDQYYFKFFPRYDLLTGELIYFKSKDFYFSNYFNSRANFKSWYAKQPTETLKEYSIKFLKERKVHKNLVYALSQVELRSLHCPSIIGFEKLFGDYYKLCFELGLKVKYERCPDIIPATPEVDSKSFITIDSREQTPLFFSLPYKVGKLDVGDYAYGNEETRLDIYFERKTIFDFVSTISQGFERFNRELLKARLSGKRLCVLVEMDLKYALVFNKLRSFCKASPEFIFNRVRGLCQEFPNIQFLFVKDQNQAFKVVEKIFRFSGDLFRYDLQLLQDLGKL